jgi:hypothetical protein
MDCLNRLGYDIEKSAAGGRADWASDARDRLTGALYPERLSWGDGGAN